MRNDSVYTSKNVILLVGIFVVIFWLLYSLASFLHESKKINDEIEAIRTQNQEKLQEIEEKKKKLAYLKTPQHIDKEAKMQMGKKQVGENVIIFIEEKLDILPTDIPQRRREQIMQEEVSTLDKWKWMFFGRK